MKYIVNSWIISVRENSSFPLTWAYSRPKKSANCPSFKGLPFFRLEGDCMAQNQAPKKCKDCPNCFVKQAIGDNEELFKLLGGEIAKGENQ